MRPEMLSGTRVFGDTSPENYSNIVLPFIKEAHVFGPVVIVSQESYKYLAELQSVAGKEANNKEKVEVALSSTAGNESPADMCNQIIKTCERNKLGFFAIVSGDLSDYIPEVMPKIVDYLNSHQNVATVGVAIQGVHNLNLLEKISKKGCSEICPENYATIFHNNAFSVHRLSVKNGDTLIPFEQRLFPRETDQGKLGNVAIDGKNVPIGGNEEIALMLKLLSQGINLNVHLLASKDMSIIRDPDKEISSIPEKVARRPLVAQAYQEHYGVSDEVLNNYLRSGHFKVSFSSI